MNKIMEETLNDYILNPKNKNNIHLAANVMISCFLFLGGITLSTSIGLSFYFFIEQSNNPFVGFFQIFLIALFFASAAAIPLSIMHIYQRNMFDDKSRSYLEHFKNTFSNNKKFAAYFIFSLFIFQVKRVIQNRSLSLLKPTEYLLFKFKNTPLKDIIAINEKYNFDNFDLFLIYLSVKHESYKNKNDFFTLLKLKNENKLSRVEAIRLCQYIEKYKLKYLSQNIDAF